MTTTITPASMIPVTALTQPVTVTRAPMLKTDEQGAVKKNAAYAGLLPYGMQIEVLAGQSIRRLPRGQEVTHYDLRTMSVTIWTIAEPEVAVGDVVRLDGIAAGMVDRNVYVYATGVETAGQDDFDAILDGAA